MSAFTSITGVDADILLSTLLMLFGFPYIGRARWP
jgi:hypothetical protein